jgi:hypothetical protein
VFDDASYDYRADNHNLCGDICSPSPDRRKAAPSVLTISLAAASTPLVYFSGFVCIFVFTTSMGVVTPCEHAAHIPPATKNRQSMLLSSLLPPLIFRQDYKDRHWKCVKERYNVKERYYVK